MTDFGTSIQVFLLKTDTNPEPLPFICSPSGWVGTSPVVLPVVEETVHKFFASKGVSCADTVAEDTLLVHLRRDFSTREIRAFVAQYYKLDKRFLLFICDSIQRSDMLINTIRKVYGAENISLPVVDTQN
ncbi:MULTISPECIES: hypothetical protein [unclassified Enterobacter cloacae complex]|uniref:hypothetical protein n=1 Tax=unclassified Enterobacter cloacae complex TaxID=2757714 RepID=UPI00187468DE|nr:MULTISPECIES: hypothetical protein [unclassified Enterobacter cloacae complex]MBE4946870.1 hypothetical protein [Enterobacter cloacae complex sp. P1B]MBE4971559.1 hypothetical protein [Enterobacter cloacae complex sp. P11RS]